MKEVDWIGWSRIPNSTMTTEPGTRSTSGIALDIAFCVVLLLIWPLTFFGVFAVWREVDRFQGRREVRSFIREHEQIVAQRLADPRVHTFTISADPEAPEQLLIQVDVDDLKTFRLIENDVSDWVSLTNAPNYQSNIRSNEDPGNDLGAMAFGMGEAVESLKRFFVAFVAASAAFLLMTIPGMWLRHHRERDSQIA